MTILDILRHRGSELFESKYATLCIRKRDNAFYHPDDTLKGIGLNFLSGFIYESDSESVSHHEETMMHAGTDIGSTEIVALAKSEPPVLP